jgi:hypothetical protein
MGGISRHPLVRSLYLAKIPIWWSWWMLTHRGCGTCYHRWDEHADR